MTCGKCHGAFEIKNGTIAFCPLCGAKLEEDQTRYNALMARALETDDPVAKHDMLHKLKAEFPNSPEADKQLIFLGRMYERGGKPDFYRIPFWPLMALERHGEFSRRERKKMMDSFFNNPAVDEFCRLYPGTDAFRDEYYEYMAKRYVDMFMKNSNANTMILGFRRKSEDTERRCRNSLDRMLKNLKTLADVPESEKARLEKALIKGFNDAFVK